MDKVEMNEMKFQLHSIIINCSKNGTISFNFDPLNFALLRSTLIHLNIAGRNIKSKLLIS